MEAKTQSRDEALRARASRVIPGGMYGHLHAGLLPPGYPQFFESGESCRLRDANGREYIDFMCSWGPIILGHKHPDVEEAARRQQSCGDCLNGPTEVMVDLAERFTARIEHADWTLFQKNGTDAMTLCVMIARAARGRRKILVAQSAYHGTAPWCSLNSGGVVAEDQVHVLGYVYNDLESLEKAAEAAGDDLAGIVVSAFRHDLGRDQEMPDEAFAQRVRALCNESNAALILDDVRAGLRLARGGSWEPLGIRPDLSAWSKAIANGYALAAVAGSDAYREAAQKVFVTGSFWCSAVAMAASAATLDVLDRENGADHVRRMGERFRNGLAEQASRHGIGIRQTGPAQMPMVLFEDDADFAKGFRFCCETVKRGIYLHPRHNMFFSLAHTPADVDRALEATDEAFGVLAALQ